MRLTHGSLCSDGVDGMAEGARREGIETIWNCEIDPFARKLLKQVSNYSINKNPSQ